MRLRKAKRNTRAAAGTRAVTYHRLVTCRALEYHSIDLHVSLLSLRLCAHVDERARRESSSKFTRCACVCEKRQISRHKAHRRPQRLKTSPAPQRVGRHEQEGALAAGRWACHERCAGPQWRGGLVTSSGRAPARGGGGVAACPRRRPLASLQGRIDHGRGAGRGPVHCARGRRARRGGSRGAAT